MFAMEPEPHEVVWRPVVGYPEYAGLYEVSEFGDVRRLAGTPYCRQTRVLRQWVCSLSYHHCHWRLTVTLSDKGVRRAVMVHHLVAHAFIGEPSYTADGELMQIDHVDGNHFNNDYRNLEYVTLQENHDRSRILGITPHGERHGRRKLTEQEVREIREMPATPAVIAVVFGISKAQVRNIKIGRHWKHLT